jgi:hypothetical protein
MPVTAMPQCDRTHPAISGGQKGFISFVVKPTFDALCDFSASLLRSMGNDSLGLNSTIENISSNLAFWKEVYFNYHFITRLAM